MAGQAPEDDEWQITPAEFSHYFAYYHRISPRGEFLAGTRAREFFLQSGLPPLTLSKIWRLSDMDEDGQLNVVEFCVAMHLVQRVLRGVSLPSSLPESILACVEFAVNPRLPIADDKHLKKCRSAFGAFHANIGKGVLGGDAARYLFMKSNLSKGQLFHIWKLSDMDGDGHLTFQEFTVAMHLIFVAKLGYFLPVDLDITTILPPSFYTIIQKVQAEAEQLPETEFVRVTIDPFSPPSTPLNLENTSTSEEGSPVGSEAFVDVVPEKLREESFDNFLGDPFLTMDPFAENGASHTDSSGGQSDSDWFVEEVESHPVEEVPLESHRAVFVESGPAAKPPRPSPPHTPPPVPPPHAPPSQSKLPRVSPPHTPPPDPPSRTSSYRSKPPQPSPPHTPPPHTPPHRLPSKSKLPQVSPPHTPPPLPPKHAHSSQAQSPHVSPSKVASEIVMEYTEPVLQQAKPVAVKAVDLEELTRLPDRQGGRRRKGYMPEKGREEKEPTQEEISAELDSISQASQKFLEESRDHLGGGKAGKELTNEEVSAELEDLSQASRTFLEESRDRLESQQECNLSSGGSYISFGMQEYRAASRKGLSTAIEEVESGLDKQEQENREPVKQAWGEEVGLSIERSDDIMAHLDDLEAEILTALDDVNNGMEEDGEPVETTDQPVTAHDEPPERTMVVERERERERERKEREREREKERERKERERERKKERERERIAEAQKRVSPPTSKPKPTRAVPGTVPIRQIQRNSLPIRRLSQEEAMEDLDDYLEGELASINEMFEQFQTKDQKKKQRILTEEEELKAMEKRAKEDNRLKLPHVTSIDEVTEKRKRESRNLEEEWEKEIKRLEEERLQALKEEEIVSELRTESNEALQNLDAEWKSLLEQEEHRLVETQKEKQLRQQREEEERQRRERERKERKENQEEMSVEEWIDWMEEKKKKGMTPAQQEEYERRKKIWIQKEKERAEKRRREEQEKIERTKELMAQEEKMYRVRERDMRKHRVGEEELKHLHRVQLRREEAEKREREERARKRKEIEMQREAEESKPKAKSALAARWEERIKARSQGVKDYRSTVVSGPSVFTGSLEREEQRMLRRISAGQNGNPNREEGKLDKRRSLQ